MTFADVLPADTSSIISLVTTGGFGALLFWLLVKRIPQDRKDEREEREAMRAQMEKMVERVSEEDRKAHATQQEAYMKGIHEMASRYEKSIDDIRIDGQRVLQIVTDQFLTELRKTRSESG